MPKFNRMMTIMAAFLTVSLLVVQVVAYGQQVSGSEILRSQELIEDDQSLREKAVEFKVFIEKIVVAGADLLSDGEIRDIISPFQGMSLSKADILEIEDLIRYKYSEIGVSDEEVRLSFKVEGQVLEVKVEEVETP